MSRLVARSASARTDDWPFWYVADTARGGLNVTLNLMPGWGGLPFVTREAAEGLVDRADVPQQEAA